MNDMPNTKHMRMNLTSSSNNIIFNEAHDKRKAAVDKKYGKKCLKVKNKNGGLALLSTNTVSKTLKARRSHEVLTSKIGSRCTDIEQGNKNGCNAVMPARRTEKKLVSSLFHNNPSIPLIKSVKVKATKEKMFTLKTFRDLNLYEHLRYWLLSLVNEEASSSLFEVTSQQCCFDADSMATEVMSQQYFFDANSMVSNLEKKMKITLMTHVQMMSIPAVMSRKDVFIKSQTGSGKTLAYAVPIVHTLASLQQKIDRSDGPYAIVVVPTRELAIQTFETFQELLQSCVWIVTGCLMGGEPRQKEKARIRKGINILVTTPGRIRDHLKNTSTLDLGNVRWLVIDEADRLLEMGYERDIADIVTRLDKRVVDGRQTILLSATLSAGVKKVAGMALTDHKYIDASECNPTVSPKRIANNVELSQEPVFCLPEKLRQHFVLVPGKLRLVTLAAFILCKSKMRSHKSKMLVFFSTQSSVEFHYQLFTDAFNPSELDEDVDRCVVSTRGLPVHSDQHLDFFKLYGDMTQKDVASRGLHLPKVDWIIQYTTPGTTVDYIHRVGRTARVGRPGNSLIFLMPAEADYVRELNRCRMSLEEMPVGKILGPLLGAIDAGLLCCKSTAQRRQLPHTLEEAATRLQNQFEESVLRCHELQCLAIKGFRSFVQAYATYPSHLKTVFSMKSLHLGHLAKSFALRHAPSDLHLPSKRKWAAEGKRRSNRLTFDDEGSDCLSRKRRRHHARLDDPVSEFSSGLAIGKAAKRGD